MSASRSFFQWIGLGLFGLIVANGLGAGLEATHTQLLPELCLFKRIFDLSCPGCGMTRAMLCLSHFDLAGAWSFNPFSLLLAGGGMVVLARDVRSEVSEIIRGALYSVERSG